MKKFCCPALLMLLLCFLSPSFTSAQKVGHVLDEALVKLEYGTDLQAFQRDLAQFNGQDTRMRVVRNISRQLNIYQVHFDNGVVNEYDFRAEIYRHPAVKIVQVNHILEQRETIPDDPFFNDQWHWVNTGQTGGTVDADLDMDLAWDITTGGVTANGDTIVVAVFDDGGDLDHPDLIANNWVNHGEIPGNGIDDDNNGYVDDVYGWNFANNNNNVDGGAHGVQVAGMIGGVGNNANQGVGANWNVKIMNNKTNFITQEALLLEFYSYAVDMRQRYTNSNGAEGAFVVATNSSWGVDGGNPDNAPLWCAFYDTLGQAGILNCGATSNQNVNVDVDGDLPTSCPSAYMVAVTATNNSDNRTFSGYGATQIDVGAPGEDVYTTASGGGYTTTSGTSFATPATAGVIGLMYSAPCPNIASLAMSDPQLAADMIRDYLFQGTENVGNLEGDVVYGRINAFNSLQLIMDNCGPCPEPSGLSASDLIDVSGNLTWNNPPDGQMNNLQYRNTNSTDWIVINDVSSPYFLDGLTACTEYEFQVEAICTSTFSMFSNSFVFTTDGCCISPEALTVTDIDSFTTVANWSAVFAAQSYNVQIRPIGGMEWTVVNTTDLTHTFTGLNFCTDYEVQVQTVCVAETTPFTESVTFRTAGCGACIDLTYCETSGDAANEEWIAGFEIGSISNSTPNTPAEGYTDFTGTAQTTTLETFNTYEFTLTVGYGGQAYPEYIRIWIDYNQDGDFTPNEMAYDAGTTIMDALTDDLIIPGDALPGLTRMRVTMRYNEAQGPCGTYDYGETEDYCVTIAPGTPQCFEPEDLTTSSITETSATLNWTDGNSSNEGFLVNYRPTGSTDWLTTTSNNPFVSVDGLTACTDYEFQVASQCSETLTSDYSATANFLTLCPCAIPLNLDTMNVSTTGATLLWDAADNAESYEVRYRLVTSSTWTTETANGTSMDLENLMECTEYNFQVRTTCINNESNWSPSFTFMVQCLSSTHDVQNGVEALELFPNPFDNQLITRFNLNERLDVTVNVYTATGKVISSQQLSLGSGEQTVTISDMQDMPNGIYFVAFTTDKGTKVRRAIKQ